MSDYTPPTVEERERYLRTQDRPFLRDEHIENAKKVLAFLDDLGLKGSDAHYPLCAAILLAYPFDFYPNVFIVISQVRAAYLKMRVDLEIPVRSEETALWKADTEEENKKLGKRLDRDRAKARKRRAVKKNKLAFASLARKIHIARLPQIA